MPSIATRSFGAVECAPEDVLTFPAGIPPFRGTKFVLISRQHQWPLAFLQSAEDAGLCFVTVPVATLDAHYELEVHEDDLRLLGWHERRQPKLAELTCLAILTVPESGEVTANLLAPILINAAAGTGVQSVRSDGRYRHDVALEALAGAKQRC